MVNAKHIDTAKVHFFGRTDKIVNGTVKPIEFDSVKKYKIFERINGELFVIRMGYEMDVIIVTGFRSFSYRGK